MLMVERLHFRYILVLDPIKFCEVQLCVVVLLIQMVNQKLFFK